MYVFFYLKRWKKKYYICINQVKKLSMAIDKEKQTDKLIGVNRELANQTAECKKLEQALKKINLDF